MAYKYICTVCLCLLLVACRSPTLYTPSVDEVLADLPTYSSVDEIWRVVANLPYVPSGREFVDPRITLEEGGDCADVSGLFMALCRKIGVETTLIGIIVRGTTGHAFIKLGDKYLEPQCYNGYYSNLPYIFMELSLEEYMARVENVY